MSQKRLSMRLMPIRRTAAMANRIQSGEIMIELDELDSSS